MVPGLAGLGWIEEDDGLPHAKHRSRRITRNLAETLFNFFSTQRRKVATDNRAQNEIAAAAFSTSIYAEFPCVGDQGFAVSFEINVAISLTRFT